MAKPLLASVALLLAGAAPAVLAAPLPPSSTPQVLQAVLDCRGLADPAARLACFDKAVASFGVAQTKGEVVVVDRAQVQAVKRQAFGFVLPSLDLFSPRAGAPKDEGDERLEVVLRSVAQTADQRLVLSFSDGSVWEQTDHRDLPDDPHAGAKAVIERGMLGAFFLKFQGMPLISVHRVR